MKILMSAAALGLAMIGGASSAFAESHVDVMNVTCAEFAAMELADQQLMLVDIAAAVDSADSDEIDVGRVQVLCNGADDESVAELLDDDN